ncbi:unnamed protein product [Tuwongella immobilis]|uniref:Uncharacterized protein n=1 Tax=Tuwongella immobilis TaxID=692036 RepID=A0A6C2YUP4_9BACT|nr:unnamed protein product [Tuwongella immobilis]VTS07788.1 unnamed protein product [Tuwongella immobilis]
MPDSGASPHKAQLQFGHRFLSVEITTCKSIRSNRRAASIRPQIFVCGNTGPPHPPVGEDHAGFNSATDFCLWKSHRSSPAFRSAFALQFGHRFLSVEMQPYFRTKSLDSQPLQFGHRFLSVEIGHAVELVETLHRFNSATDFCLWKYEFRRLSRTGLSRFNSATDFCLWKCRHCGQDRRRCRTRFNSATDFCLWKYVGQIKIATMYISFNSATDFCLWKSRLPE